MERVYALSCDLGGKATRTVLTCAAMLNNHVDDCFPLELGPLESDQPPKYTEITKCAFGNDAPVNSMWNFRRNSKHTGSKISAMLLVIRS